MIETGLASMCTFGSFGQFSAHALLSNMIGHVGLFSDRDPASPTFNPALQLMFVEFFTGLLPLSLAHFATVPTKMVFESMIAPRFLKSSYDSNGADPVVPLTISEYTEFKVLDAQYSAGSASNATTTRAILPQRLATLRLPLISKLLFGAPENSQASILEALTVILSRCVAAIARLARFGTSCARE